MVKVTNGGKARTITDKVAPAQDKAVAKKELDITLAEDTPEAKHAPAAKKAAADEQFAEADARNDPFDKVKPEELAAARAVGVTF